MHVAALQKFRVSCAAPCQQQIFLVSSTPFCCAHVSISTKYAWFVICGFWKVMKSFSALLFTYRHYRFRHQTSKARLSCAAKGVPCEFPLSVSPSSAACDQVPHHALLAAPGNHDEFVLLISASLSGFVRADISTSEVPCVF